MLSTAAPRASHVCQGYPCPHHAVAGGSYTLPAQADPSVQQYLQLSDMSLIQPSEHQSVSHSRSPSSDAGSHHISPSAGGVPPNLYLQTLSSPSENPPMGDTSFTLDPTFLLHQGMHPANSNQYDMLSYNCIIPGADDETMYYSVGGSDSASPVHSSPTSPSSSDSSVYSPGGLSPAMMSSSSPMSAAGRSSPTMPSQRQYGPGVSPITPPVLPNTGYAQMGIATTYNVPANQHQAAYTYSYPLYNQATYGPQTSMQPQMVQSLVQMPMAQYQPVYPMGVQYGYAQCVDPNALAGHAHAAPPAAPAPPTVEAPSSTTRRDRRTARQRDPNYVPRPPNPFICFRQDWLKRLQRGEVDYTGPRDQRTMSFTISSDWNKMPESAKAKFRRDAQNRKREHARKYPGYKFAPRQKDRELSPSGSEDN